MKKPEYPILIDRDADKERLNASFLSTVEKSILSVVAEWEKLNIGPLPGNGIKGLDLLIQKTVHIVKETIFEIYKSQIPGADRFPPDREQFFRNIKLPDLEPIIIKCHGVQGIARVFKPVDEEQKLHIARYFSFDPKTNELERNEAAWTRYIEKDSLFLHNDEDLYIYRLSKIIERIASELKINHRQKFITYVGFDLAPDDSTKWRTLRPDQFVNLKEKLKLTGVYNKLNSREDLLDDLVFKVDDLLS